MMHPRMNGTPKNEQIWLRREGETNRAYAAFEIFLKLGPGRTQKEAARNLGKTPASLTRWAKKNDWATRATQYDRHNSRKVNQAMLADQAKMRQRAVTQAMNLQARAAQKLLSMNQEDINKMPPVAAAKILKIGVALERWARDIPMEEADERPFQVIVNVVGSPEGQETSRTETEEPRPTNTIQYGPRELNYLPGRKGKN